MCVGCVFGEGGGGVQVILLLVSRGGVTGQCIYIFFGGWVRQIMHYAVKVNEYKPLIVSTLC